MRTPLTAQQVQAARHNDKIGTELVLEMPGMRVWHIRLRPNETLAAHRHDRPYFWTAMTDGQGCARFGDGRIVDAVYYAGQTQYFKELSPENYFVHELTNTGSADLVFVTVEFEMTSAPHLMLERLVTAWRP